MIKNSMENKEQGREPQVQPKKVPEKRNDEVSSKDVKMFLEGKKVSDKMQGDEPFKWEGGF